MSQNRPIPPYTDFLEHSKQSDNRGIIFEFTEDQLKSLLRNFLILIPFSEKLYLLRNPELSQAKSDNIISSGHAHYIWNGYFESRRVFGWEGISLNSSAQLESLDSNFYNVLELALRNYMLGHYYASEQLFCEIENVNVPWIGFLAIRIDNLIETGRLASAARRMHQTPKHILSSLSAIKKTDVASALSLNENIFDLHLVQNMENSITQYYDNNSDVISNITSIKLRVADKRANYDDYACVAAILVNLHFPRMARRFLNQIIILNLQDDFLSDRGFADLARCLRFFSALPEKLAIYEQIGFEKIKTVQARLEVFQLAHDCNRSDVVHNIFNLMSEEHRSHVVYQIYSASCLIAGNYDISIGICHRFWNYVPLVFWPVSHYLLAMRERRIVEGADNCRTQLKSNKIEFSRIPLVIIQFWDDESIPDDVRQAMTRWQDLHPNFVHLLFSEKSAREYLQKEFDDNAVKIFDYCFHPAMKADYFRFCFLLKEGGVYIDADEDCQEGLQSISSFLSEKELVLAFAANASWVNNAFIAASPNNRIIARVVERINLFLADCMENSNRPSVWSATGPGQLNAALAEALSLTAERKNFSQTVAILYGRDLERVSTVRNMKYKSSRGGDWRKVNETEP